MWKIFKKKSKFRTGSNFTSEEKKAIINAINYAREVYNSNDNEHGLCALLYKYFYSENMYNTYAVLTELYHNREYYNSKNLNAEYLPCGYWWPIGDIKSRLKALDILEKAVIND